MKKKIFFIIESILISSLFLFIPQSNAYAAYYVQDSAASGLTYTGTWTTWTDPAALFGSVKATYNEGDSVSWTFTGDRVAY